MKTVDYEGYLKYKMRFFEKHGDWSVNTSPMNEYGEYHKTYYGEDGSEMHENMRPVYTPTTCTVKGLTIKLTVKLLETELYSSDDAQSIYHYEKFNHEKEAVI